MILSTSTEFLIDSNVNNSDIFQISKLKNDLIFWVPLLEHVESFNYKMHLT